MACNLGVPYMNRVFTVPKGSMPHLDRITAKPKPIMACTKPLMAYASRRAKSTGGLAFVYEAAASMGFRYPKTTPSESGGRLWNAKNAKPSR